MIQEKLLVHELQQLQATFKLSDKSDAMIAQGKRMAEIRKELGLVTRPRKNYVKAKVVNR